MSIYFQENKASEGHGRRSLKSGAVSVVARGVNIFVQVGSTICLARLLTPHDYGLVAMVSAIVGFAPMLMDLGTADAIVQKPRIVQAEVSALFWLNAVIGLLLALGLCCAAPLIARFYHQPEIQAIALVTSINFVFAAICLQHYALLRRAMRFQRIAVIDVSASLLGALVAVVMALSGWGYWSLVARPIVTAFGSALGVYLSCPWLPSVPKVTSEVMELLKFGLNVTGFTLTDYAGRSADRVALGYFYGAKELGYFQNALLLYDNLLSVVTSPLHTVAVTALSKLRDNVEQLKRSWAAALSSLSFFAMPAFALLAVTANDVTVVLLGKKWAAAGPLLSVIAIRGIAHVVERTLGWLHVAAARSDRWLRWGLLSSVVQLAALAAGLPFGLMGVATSYTVAMYILFVPAITYAGAPLGIGARDVFRVIGPQCISAVVTTAFGFWLRLVIPTGLGGMARIALLLAACAGLYLFLAVVVFKIVRPLKLVFSLVRDYLPRWLSGFSDKSRNGKKALSGATSTHG